MGKIVKAVGFGILVMTLLAAGSVRAGSIQVGNVVEVKVTEVDPRLTYSINSPELGVVTAHVGIYNLDVDGVMVDSFCIDINQYSPSSKQDYNVVELTDAPEPGLDGVQGAGQMSTAQADLIRKLWKNYYPTIGTVYGDDQDAANLQLAIWKVLYEDVFVGGNVPVSVQNTVNQMISDVDNSTSTGADLVALSNYAGDKKYQDYVVPRVPDAGMTLVLLGMALGGLGLVRRQI